MLIHATRRSDPSLLQHLFASGFFIARQLASWRPGQLLAALTASVLLAACGGGGGTPTPVTPECPPYTSSFNETVTCAQMATYAAYDTANNGGNGGGTGGDAGGDGSAGDGAPIANAKLRFVDVDNRAIDTTTDANGYFRINLRGMKTPIVASVLRDNLPWKSMLVEQIVPGTRQFYTINLTALTDKISSDVAKAAGLSGAAQLTPSVVQANLAQVQVAKDALNAQLTEKLVEAGLNPATFNALTMPFKPDLTGYDKVLENVVVVQNPGGTTELQPKHSVGGVISGSGNRAGLVLKNGTDSLSIASANATSFAMPVQVLPGTAYNVQITTQPSGATCAITNASGTVANANVTSINLICSGTTYSLGGTVAGLGNASGLVLTTNGQDLGVPASSSSFAFATGLPAGTAYSVSVKTQPTGATCSVASGGSGSMPASNHTSVAINCSASSARLGGSISGLSASGLQLGAAGQSISVAAGATSFVFANPVAYGTAYNTTIQTQPTGQACTLSNGSGNMGAADINSISVNCSANAATLGGVVKNLNGYGLILRSNGESLSVSPSLLTITPKPDVSFSFPTPLSSGTAFSVNVQSQPVGQTCTVGNGSGTMVGVNVTSVVVTCGNDPLYTLGGSVSGNSGALVLSAGGQSVTVPSIQCVTSPCVANFTFGTSLAAGTAYSVTVQTQPTGQTCTVSNGSGAMPAANVSSVAVNCVSNTYSLGGSISGLTGSGLVLSGGFALSGIPSAYMQTVSLAANASSFSFTGKIASGWNYTVAVQTQPAGQNCTVSNSSGTMPAANVSSVVVNCVPVTSSYTLGGSISGLTASGLMLVGGGQTITLPANASSFSFPTAIAAGTAYSVAVESQPSGLTCSVSNGSGTMPAANVNSVSVTCAVSTAGTARVSGVWQTNFTVPACNRSVASTINTTYANNQISGSWYFNQTLDQSCNVGGSFNCTGWVYVGADYLDTDKWKTLLQYGVQSCGDSSARINSLTIDGPNSISASGSLLGIGFEVQMLRQ